MLVIVLPTKDRLALLQRAIESVRTQQYPHWRAVIVNDGSHDGTERYLSSLADARISVLHRASAGGVNAARNSALRTLAQGEWGVQLDDDDVLLPEALETIAAAIADTPDAVELLFFNTRIAKLGREYEGGRRFSGSQTWREFTYEELMQGVDRTGDSRMVWKWTLFPEHLFDERVNGFESSWILSLARKGIGIRYRREQTTWVDLSHAGVHLSATAAKEDPLAFTRIHAQMFREHHDYYLAHPGEAAASAKGAAKLAIRALAPLYFLRFAWIYLRSRLRGRVALAQDQHNAEQNVEGIG